MITGKILKISSIGDVAGLSSSVPIEVRNKYDMKCVFFYFAIVMYVLWLFLNAV